MPEGASLQVRRKSDGTVHVTGELPDVHAFNARHVARELEHPYGSMFEVYVVVKTANVGDAVYRLTGFGELDPDNPDDDRLNLNTWEVSRVEDEKAATLLRAFKRAGDKESGNDG